MKTILNATVPLTIQCQTMPLDSRPIEGATRRARRRGRPLGGGGSSCAGLVPRLLLCLFMLAWGVNAALAQGALTNGWAHTGTISPIGDADAWTFSATTGDRLVIRVGEISQTNAFTPRIRLQNPGLVEVAADSGALAAEIAVTATNTGTYTVIVDDAVGTSATGTYRLTLARFPGASLVAPGDNGGPTTNGVMHLGTILTGDLDLWTFTANNGDNLVVRMGQITETNTFYTWVRLYGPDGALLESSVSATVAEVTMRATNSGTFIVLVGDGNGGLYGSGDYRLTLARTGDPVVVSPGDNGGPMTNGVMHLGTILTGDLDLWTFTANNGDNLVVRMGQITETNTFYTWVRLYGPDGALLESSVSATVAEVTMRATNSGTFMVAAGDGNGGLFGSGDYRLTLARTGGSLEVASGDEGGPLIAGIDPEGVISFGDLDVYAFTICKGEHINLRLDELIDQGTFFPWLRLYGPDGALLQSLSGSATAQINLIATNSGTFIAVVSDGNGALSGIGTYRLTSNGLLAGLRLCPPIISGANVNLGGVGGVSNATYILYTHTDVVAPAASWAPIRTNQFDPFGTFHYTNVFNPSGAARHFYLLEQL
ncbi:MAG TPA: hypothetical protein PLU91_17640 [Verrucomicrobiota bacterium]|nr:hypothetical protein [Verrucomicrobiota bacterium]